MISFNITYTAFRQQRSHRHWMFAFFCTILPTYVLNFSTICLLIFQVTWRPVLWGLLLQFLFALIVLRTRWGYAAFEWLGERAREYLGHTKAGSVFMFGNNYMDHMFAFSVSPKPLILCCSHLQESGFHYNESQSLSVT